MRSYFIKLGEDEKIILTPYESFSVEGSVPEDAELVSSSLLEQSEEEEAVYSMKKDASRSVSRWIQDKRYFPRLFVTALIFIVVYFIGSLAIRDPIPMIDELLIAAVLSALFWVWAVKMDEKAQSAIAKRDELFKEIDYLTETQSPYIRDLEEHYEKYEGFSDSELSRLIADGKIEDFIPYEEYEAMHREVVAMLFQRLGRVEKGMLKTVRDIKSGRLTGRKCEEKLLHRAKNGIYSPKKIAFLLSLMK